MIHNFSGKSADEVWAKALSSLQAPDQIDIQTSRAGDTKEILHAAFSIEDPRQRWVTTRKPPINPAFAIAEVVWIVSGRNDAKFMNYWNTQLARYSGSGEIYHGAYGFRLRQHLGFDQLERAYQVLRNSSESRQVVLQIWDSKSDLPFESGQPVNPDIPCNIGSLLKVRGGKLEWLQMLRSNDLFRGVPYNFVQFTSLQEIMAGWLGLELGTYNHFSDSLHLYTADAPKVSALLTPAPLLNQDSLLCSKAESDEIFEWLNSKLELLTDPALKKAELTSLISSKKLPTAYHNLFMVTTAEAARRRGWVELTQLAMGACTSSMLRNLWKQWFAKFPHPKAA